MMSKRTPTPGEKQTVRKSGDIAVIMTANGMSGSTQEAAVYINDLVVYVTVMLLEDSPAVLSLGLLCEEMGVDERWTK